MWANRRRTIFPSSVRGPAALYEGDIDDERAGTSQGSRLGRVGGVGQLLNGLVPRTTAFGERAGGIKKPVQDRIDVVGEPDGETGSGVPLEYLSRSPEESTARSASGCSRH